MLASGSSRMANRVAHESGTNRQRLRPRLGFEVRRFSPRKKATSKVAFCLGPPTRQDMKRKPAEKKEQASDSFSARPKVAEPDVPSTGQGIENQSNVITAECSLANIPRAVPVAASTVNKVFKPDPEPQREETSSASSSLATAPQSPSSTITMSRYQLCILLNKVVDVVAAAASGTSEDYDFSMLESLAPHLDKQQASDDDDDEDQITMTHNKLNMIVTSIVQGTKSSVANKTSLPSGIELPGMGPNGSIVHLSWPPDPPGEYHPQTSSI